MLGRIWTLLAFRRTLTLAWRLFKDRRVSLLAKSPIVIGILFLLSPIGLRLDFVPVLGGLDILTVLVVAVSVFVRLCPKELVREHIDAMSGRPPKAPPGSGDVIEGDYEILE
jgi:uncharacterized membrane protein YkvA (DUF1232 family)